MAGQFTALTPSRVACLPGRNVLTCRQPMQETYAKFRKLDADKIVETVEALHARIEERFPDSGLGKVVAELLDVAEETVSRTEWIQKAHLPLRCVAGLLSLFIVAVVVAVILNIHKFQLDDFVNTMQGLDSAIGSVVFIGAAILFFVGWETRIKRRRALKAIHELRALAHIIDMHQLTKDPESYFGSGVHTTFIQKRRMTPFELNRYLDYCSDALAVISKIAALYVQGFEDPVVLECSGRRGGFDGRLLPQDMQKSQILDNLNRPMREPDPARTPEHEP